MTVRTRIAPSPTGDPHLGTAYIALFNLCFARQHSGQFILRIEDTDQARSTPESEKAILDSLRWLGLDWDEGPDVGGPHGPYRQSERMHIYKDYALELINKGHAFYCFATSEELDQMRAEQMARGETPKYDGRSLKLTPADVEQKLAAGEPYVIRMKIPEQGECEIDDLLRGKIVIDWQQVDMQVLMKADGMPTYHLANVVDDHLMAITHVIRGEEWINSAPKHILLYQYFGWDVPVFCHLPLLRNPDKSKLSKRKNPTSINYYRRMGYMPEALLNYLARMGWSMPNEEEKFTLEEMFENFDLKTITLGGPVFDIEKLDWLNGRWIRENLDADAFAARVGQWALNESYLKPLIPLIQSRVERFSQLPSLVSFFFSGMPDISKADFDALNMDDETLRRLLQYTGWMLDTQRSWQRDDLYESIKGLAEAMGMKIKPFLQPLFIALTGSTTSPPLFDSMSLLGSDLTRARLREALQVAGGVSKKETKQWEKDYRALGLAER
ncbi:MAG: glutamate--tRNA ligase [Cellvibrionales bacterium]|nr:glutamate--tRNA ligase [Cellvibrionales bacterium]